MRVKDAVGRWGEQVAADALAAAGLSILERNWRCPQGEIDIIAVDGEALVFCEVKTRSSVTFGSPVEAVRPAKAARIRRLARLWLAEHPGWEEVRFDVVSVVRAHRGHPAIEHLRGAF